MRGVQRHMPSVSFSQEALTNMVAQAVLGRAVNRTMARNRKCGLPNRKLWGSFTERKKKKSRGGKQKPGKTKATVRRVGEYPFPTARPKEGSLWSALPRRLMLFFQRTLLDLILLKKERGLGHENSTLLPGNES